MLKYLLKFCIWIRSVTLTKFLLKYEKPNNEMLVSAISTENKKIFESICQELGMDIWTIR